MMIRNAIVVSMMSFAGVVNAAPTVTFDYDVKEKQNVSQGDTHRVYGLSVMEKVWIPGLSVGAKMENEISDQSQKNESLMQAQIQYDVGTYHGFTPYVNGAVGMKYRNNSDISFYVAGIGLKYALTDSITLVAASRLRTPFNELSMGEGSKYRTIENSIGANYALNKNWVVGGRYKQERGDSNYNTYNVSLSYKF